MHVGVRLYAGLGEAGSGATRGDPIALELEEGATVRTAIEALGLPQERIHLIFVNGTARRLDHPLANGDRVGLFPPVGGG